MSTKLRLLALPALAAALVACRPALDPLPDAPCATLYRFAPTEMWPEPEECLNENGDYR